MDCPLLITETLFCEGTFWGSERRPSGMLGGSRGGGFGGRLAGTPHFARELLAGGWFSSELLWDLRDCCDFVSGMGPKEPN